MDDDGSFEEVFENDDGEELHLQKIANKKQEPVVDETIEEPEQHKSSRKSFLLVKNIESLNKYFLNYN